MVWAGLFDEYVAALEATTIAQVRWAIARGIPSNVFEEVPAAFGFMRIRPNADGSYEPDANGIGALIVPVTEYICQWMPDEIYDLAAWTPTEPGTVWTRRREAWMLGLPNVDGALDTGEALRVNASPLSWLVEGRRGVVVLDWDEPLRERLRGLAQLDAENAEIAHCIRWNLANRPAPPLVTVNAGSPPPPPEGHLQGTPTDETCEFAPAPGP